MRVDEQEHQQVAADDGFTLLEVVVSLGMLAVIASAALAFFVTGVRTSAELQRHQAAVALANAAVEDARSVRPAMVTTAPASGGGAATSWPTLVKGRAAAAVATQWARASAADAATTYPASDPAPAAGVPALVPLVTTATVSKQTFTTSVLIGTCYRQRSATGAPCTRPAGAARTAVPPAGYSEMVRIIATTRWDPGAGRTCAGGECSYSTSVLVDPSADPEWSTNGGEAVDDVADAVRGRATTLAVLANDTVVPASSSPVTVTAQPAGATATAQADGTIRLDVPASTPPGQVELRYAVRTTAGGLSNAAVVRVRIVSAP